MPYWICTSWVRRQESPSAMEPVNWPEDRRRAVSVRLYDAGSPASRSSSELKKKLPNKFDDWSCVLPLNCSSVVSLMRCLFASSNHERLFCTVALDERDVELRPWLPPNVSICTPLAPS